MRILFLTQICPYPPSSGGAIKTYNILKHLGSKHDVSLLMFVRREDEISAVSHLARFCREIGFCSIRRSGMRNMLDAISSLRGRKSFIIARDWQPEMRAKVTELLGRGQDLLYVDHLQMFQYVPSPSPCPILLDEHNVEWQIIERFASAGTPPAQRFFASLEWRKLRAYELNACRRADRVLTVTEQDRATLTSYGVPGSRIVHLPIGVDVDFYRPVSLSAESARILTFGTMSWPPNADSVHSFAKSIYPLVRREVPEARFSIVGANPPPAVRALAERDPSIEVTGFVKDIRAAAEGAAVFVVPLRIGSGMRVKILDAMALGLPIVTTSIGCEGISLKSGEHALVADAPKEFADAVVHLLLDPAERARLGAAGRRLVESTYSWPPILAGLDSVLSELERGL